MSRRTDRVDGELQREIAAILSGELKNRRPDLKGMISVTEVDASPDFKTAKVYVSIYAVDEAGRKAALAILKESAGLVRHELAKVMRMRTVPALTFLEDTSMAYGSHMDELFASLHKSDKDEDADRGDDQN